jgi:hypothetical protein
MRSETDSLWDELEEKSVEEGLLEVGCRLSELRRSFKESEKDGLLPSPLPSPPVVEKKWRRGWDLGLVVLRRRRSAMVGEEKGRKGFF